MKSLITLLNNIQNHVDDVATTLCFQSMAIGELGQLEHVVLLAVEAIKPEPGYVTTQLQPTEVLHVLELKLKQLLVMEPLPHVVSFNI